MGRVRVGLRLVVVVAAVWSPIALPPAGAEPIAVASGHFTLPWDDPPAFRLSAPGTFELSGLFPIGTLSPHHSCIGGCRPAALVNLTSIAGGTGGTELFPLGRATDLVVNGKRFAGPFGLGPESPRLAGTLRFDAGSVALPPIPTDSFFVELRAPFMLSGDVRGYSHDDLDGRAPLFDVTMSGQGTAAIRFDVLGDKYGDPSVTYTMSPVSVTPEPASLVLMAVAASGLAARLTVRRRLRR